jgi:DNA helicase HerA-like ATPase
VGAIQRGLLQIESPGRRQVLRRADAGHQRPACRPSDGKGVINILAADKLMNSPRLYATFLLWMLSELFEQLPEIGDPDKPKLVFFFDEAHLLFNEAPKVLVERIELVVRLVRSKGVGVYFVTQNPLDIPDSVLAQLGNRVQHALRAFTPRDQKAVKATAQTMRQKPGLDIETAITELAVGEALVSLLDAKGRPSITERVYVLPPGSQIGPITPQQRQALMPGSLVAGVYEKTVDRESAYEKLNGRAEAAALRRQVVRKAAQPAPPTRAASWAASTTSSSAPPARAAASTTAWRKAWPSRPCAPWARTVGREIIRGVLGSIFGGKKR